MAYMHIDNLYKDTNILQFKECYAMEKLHGTSAHITFKQGRINYFAGGGKHETFVELFDEKDLLARFAGKGIPEDRSVTVYGESYGGKQQGQSWRYGKEARFAAFEVKIGDSWLSVPQAEDFAKGLGFDFVPWVKCSTDIEILDEQRDSPSIQASKCGMGEDIPKEGIVLRPLMEVKTNNGERIIAKHKREEERETKTKREVNAEQLAMIREAYQRAEEWVTYNRLANILSHIPEPHTIQMTGDIIKIMIEDVEREGEGEILLDKPMKGQIGKQAAQLYKKYLNDKLHIQKETGDA